MKDRIIETLTRIETKLDEVIAALHAYDGDEWDEPNDALKEAAAQYNEKIHHVTNEEADEDAFDDYGERVYNKDIQDKRVGEKKRNKRKYYKPKQKN